MYSCFMHVLQELMTYCADDVNATHAVFKQMWPQFKSRYELIMV